MKKAIHIRPAQFTQIGELAQNMLDTIDKGSGYKEAIASIISKYFKSETLEPTGEYQHRYGNDVGHLQTVAFTIQLFLKDHPKQHASIMEDVKTIATWKEARSTSGETHPVAVKRSIKALEKLVEDNQSRFSAEEKTLLKENIAGLKRTIRAVEKHVKTAQELCDAIMPERKRG